MSQIQASEHVHAPSGPVRDEAGVAKYRHEAIAVVLQSCPTGECRVLCVQRTREPFVDKWSLPSGAMEVDESLEDAITRHLAAKVNLTSMSYAEQLGTRSDPARDPFDRTIATAYLVLIPWDQEWDLPVDASWLLVDELPPMAFDHQEIVELAVARLQAKLSYTNIGFALTPEEFRMSDLAQSYAAIMGHEVSATNLQRILARRGQLKATGKKAAPGAEGGRPAKLFSFAQRSLEITDQFATLRP
ncbi:NUDIX domain-containing protein [Corynebacterium breve]|uniref:NUDIX domain-containing protein n=1 Tax=Corynebacterium breve TaxID=3049799 RepID=A0ABY8VH52_9CORY|nr:NUDIX domain-containing protein [Corynebacterium breve]WIM68095.1 NUDIX domain-containing protein [Corynebacterium breve]